jgi:DNA-directed RNA polymerase specialized sigma24 family protein
MQRTLTLEEKVSQLFELLRDPIYLYLIAVLGNPAEAEDVTQEVFLELYRALHRGRVINNVRLWLFRVAHNVAFKDFGNKQLLATSGYMVLLADTSLRIGTPMRDLVILVRR